VSEMEEAEALFATNLSTFGNPKMELETAKEF
jgi:hypothetical protein